MTFLRRFLPTEIRPGVWVVQDGERPAAWYPSWDGEDAEAEARAYADDMNRHGVSHPDVFVMRVIS
ncbi:hypothetical protein [Iamia sp.]|uniref:hypothetical protein n=1 Tax=Iamia sp. TaxID=2722710 RepID=UPI002C3E8F4B|nr:hypothetical protein [Iamia sp.]HXH57921.1 hypothetical protein [Iamia sp.]